MKRSCYLSILKEGFSAYSKASHASEQENDKRQKGCDRFQTFKYENSLKQSGLSLIIGHIYLVG